LETQREQILGFIFYPFRNVQELLEGQNMRPPFFHQNRSKYNDFGIEILQFFFAQELFSVSGYQQTKFHSHHQDGGL
jgi:hypothetical protein